MAKKRAKENGNGSGDAKVVIYTRVDPVTVAALDAIRGGMRPKPTRAQLIDAALAEYVERYGDGKARP